VLFSFLVPSSPGFYPTNKHFDRSGMANMGSTSMNPSLMVLVRTARRSGTTRCVRPGQRRRALSSLSVWGWRCGALGLEA